MVIYHSSVLVKGCIMSDFSIKINEVRVLAQTLGGFSGTMQSYKDETESILRTLDHTSSLGGCLRLFNPDFKIYMNIRDTRKMSDQLERILQRYQQAEKKNSGMENKDSSSNQFEWIGPGFIDIINRVVPPAPRPNPWSLMDVILAYPDILKNYFENHTKDGVFHDERNGEIKNDFFSLIGRKVTYSWNMDGNNLESTGKWSSKDKNKLVSIEGNEVGKKESYDSNSGTWTKTKEYDDLDAGLKLGDAKNSHTYTFAHFNGKFNIENLNDPSGLSNEEYKMEIDGFKGEVYQEAYATWKGAGVGIGLEGTILSLLFQKKTGTDEFNTVESLGTDIGKVDIGLEAKTGLDQENKFGAYAEAKAEAILAEAEKKFEVDLFGIKIDGKGKVDYGAGAHAKAGLKDGKLVYDVGAAAGFGGGVSIEVDVSDLLNEIYERSKPVRMIAETAVGEHGENIDSSIENAKRMQRAAEYVSKMLYTAK